MDFWGLPDNVIQVIGQAYPEVTAFADLPSGKPAGSIYTVATTTGIWPFRKVAGLYRYDGAAWKPLPSSRNLGEISDVAITSPADLQYLGFNSASGGWENKTLSASGGVIVVQALGVKSVDFTVDRANGEYATVTTDAAAIAMTLASPASSTNSYRQTVAILQGATARVVTLKGTDANIISSGGLMSSGDALPNSGANTLDIFTFEWNGAKWETIDARFDVKA